MLWINKHFRSCNNATIFINSGTSSVSSTKTQASCTAGPAERPAATLAGWKKMESESQDESRFCKLFLDSKMTEKPVHHCFGQ